MAWRYREQGMAAGDYITPQEINANIGAAGSEMVRLDRDNFTFRTVASDRFKVNTFDRILWAKLTFPAGLTIPHVLNNYDGVWTEVASLAVTGSLRDGRLACSARLVIIGGSSDLVYQMGIQVDDTIYAMPEGDDGYSTSGTQWQTLVAAVTIPIGAGTHRVVPVFRSTDADGVSPAVNITVDGGHMRARNMKR